MTAQWIDGDGLKDLAIRFDVSPERVRQIAGSVMAQAGIIDENNRGQIQTIRRDRLEALDRLRILADTVGVEYVRLTGPVKDGAPVAWEERSRCSDRRRPRARRNSGPYTCY